MKALTTITILFAASIVYGQEVKQIEQKSTDLKPVQKVEKQRAEAKLLATLKTSIFGSFVITHYSVLGLETPSSKEIEQIVGSSVTVSPTKIAGVYVSHDVFDIFEVADMSSGDYIYQMFGRVIRAPEPNLPHELTVHKTDNADCYGIIDLPGDKLAIPYKGLLLFLERNK